MPAMAGQTFPSFSLSATWARRLVTIAGVFSAVAALAVVAYFVLSERRALVDAAGAALSRSAGLSATLVDQIVRDSDAIASGFQVALKLHEGTLREFTVRNRDWLEGELTARPVVRSYALLDTDGTVVATGLPELLDQNLAGRDYFIVHTRPNGPDRFVSEPIMSRLRSAYRLFLISWPLYDRDGVLIGVFVLSLNTDRIEALLGEVDDAPHDALAIVTASGSILAAQGRGGAQSLPSDYREPLLIRAASQSLQSPATGARAVEGYLWERPSTWLVASTTVETFPAAIVAARDLETVLAPWRERAAIASVAALAIAVLSACLSMLLREIIHRQDREVGRVTLAAATDPLTGLLNRRGFAGRAEAEWSRGHREHYPVAVLVLDLDHFKAINDGYGHDAGDAVLARIADRLTDLVRRADIVARTGGEEFAMLLPHMRPDAVEQFAERVRASVEALTVTYEGAAIRLTVSIGVRVTAPRLETTRDAMRYADLALYEAKRRGRNRAALSLHESLSGAGGTARELQATG